MTKKCFAVKHSSNDEPFTDTVAANTNDAIQRFLGMSGCGCYIDKGWLKAVKDGYSVAEYSLTPLRLVGSEVSK